jgi:hypothetical protein
MANDFNVPFLGRIPIDPQFVMLIETGRKPEYPQGTVINGQDFSKDVLQNGQDGSTGEVTKDASMLAEKYRGCSLEAVFRKITRDIVATVR